MHLRDFRYFLFFLFLPLAVCAAENKPGLSLSEALARTLSGSPELTAYNWEVRAAEARILQAGLRPSPELAVEIENPTGSGAAKNGDEMQDTLSLSQLIELGGKRPARVREAKAGHAVVAWEYQARRVEVLKAATLAFIDALAAQQRIALAHEIVQVADETVKLTEQRVSVGKVGAVEAIRARVAVSTAEIELEQARRDGEVARGQLAAQWGARAADFSAVRGQLDRHERGPALQTLRERLLGNPDLARWTAEREKRQAKLTKEQSLARSDITVMAGPRLLGQAEDVSFVAGFSIPLPFGNRNQGNIAEAQANLAKLDDEKRAAEARAFAALNEAYQKLSSSAKEIALLEDNVIPGAKDAETQLNEGYAAGRFTQFEVLDARRTRHAAQLQLLRALADFQRARAEIDALTALPAELPRPADQPARRK